MMYSAEQVINGITRYADNEIMTKLPTTGKWVFGTAFNLANNKLNDVVQSLLNNAIVKMLGIVDDNGNIDVDALILAMKESADKYGNINVDLPLVGRLSFSASDIDSLRSYIG